ncbi:sensor histidine kinase [Microbispora bryophytorum]|uniref:histidine kinase n=1 Tax=Microbispora bryophytorum subsp. camponoti TaxID=1677852 RepID=A0ABR8KSV7_9ACTN|nr:HAMP domain-containing sensor histidine kinase [Microbispora camponoti]MBD3141832.1 HAMP domain-containing histidine kinase [Microbispora camponoti]
MSAVLSLVFLTVIGFSLDIAIRNRIHDHLFMETQRVATDWISSMGSGGVPEPPATHKDLVQLVDSRNRVITASRAARGLAALTTPFPTDQDPLQYRIACPDEGRCVVLTAVRVLPMQSRLFWDGEPHAVYAGRTEPGLLASRRLELFIGIGVLLMTAGWTWASWRVAGRTLRPVREIRERVTEISVRDLTLRVPQPSGRDEIAELARASNHLLEHLDTSVRQQKHFASMVSHELRSPLAGLRTQLEEALLYREETDPYETIRTAVRTTERCQAIIDEMLTVARVRTAATGEPELVSLGALAREEAAARTDGVPVHVEVEDEVTVLGNRVQLCGVLTNLMVNAQRHACSRVDVTVGRAGGEAVVTVLDDGDGIAPEDRERVFEPFVRLKEGRRRDPKGTGLGLALCRVTADTHHGTLRVEDSPRGARFVLRLPLPAGVSPVGAGQALSR